ncbi:hypothetical protein K7711_01310 [Nocardia sp. CA2R105]|uniref:hypothetical protein n=1 Tax=Nocardia coffeae TaxID=2873381 RepID=UPI001CA76A2D|nr:hypothetical protein [Nocardia coffeae]MBY8855107.1 hypothetical protein [Nocardia coffeae]
MTAPRPPQVLEFKQQLKELVDTARGSSSQGRLAELAAVSASALSKALGDHPLPTWEGVGKAIVSTCLRRLDPSLDPAELAAAQNDWETRWKAAHDAQRKPGPVDEPPANPPEGPSGGPVPPEPAVWQRKKRVLIAGGVVVVLAVAVGAVAVVTDRMSSHASEVVAAAMTTAQQAEDCVTKGIIGSDGVCIDADQLPADMQPAVEAIIANNKDAATAPAFNSIGVPVPMPLLSSDSGEQGQLNDVQLQQLLGGAATGQAQHNKNGSASKVQLALGDVGVQQAPKDWTQPIGLMKLMAENLAAGHGRLLATTTLTTSVVGTNDAAKQLWQADSITDLGPIANADLDILDPRVVSMMPRTTNLITALDTWIGDHYPSHPAVELLDQGLIDANDLYVESLKKDFESAPHIAIGPHVQTFNGVTQAKQSTSNGVASQEFPHEVCTADVLAFAGRDADLRNLIAWLTTSCGSHEPSVILTVGAAMSSIDDQGQTLRGAGMSVIYASSAYPYPNHPSPDDSSANTPPPGWTAYAANLNAVFYNVPPHTDTTIPSVYGCLTRDAVLSLTQAIQAATTPTAPLDPRSVSKQLPLINRTPENSFQPCSDSTPVTFTSNSDGTIAREKPPTQIILRGVPR